MKSLKNVVGKKPKFIVLDKYESTDINDQFDFKLAQSIYKNFYKKL